MNTTRTLRTHHPIDPLLRPSDARAATSLPSPMAPAAPSSAEARVAALAARNGRGSSPTAPAARRGKPARRAKLTALTLSAASTVSLAGLFAHQDDSASAISLAVVTQPAVSAGATATPNTTATTTATTDATATTATTTAATVTTAASVAGVADGTYVGVSDSNRWGTVQVQVVYSGGVVADVQIIQYPDGDDKSVRINQRALPTLISESLSAQRADVSTVSGATYTSVSYRVSLQSAIDAAKSVSGIG